MSNREKTEAAQALPRRRINGEAYDRLRQGAGPYDGDLCRTCDAREGQLHWWGCKEEACPCCREEMWSCACARGNYLPAVEPEHDESETLRRLREEVLELAGRVTALERKLWPHKP